MSAGAGAKLPEEIPVARSPDGGLLLIKRETADGFALLLKPWPTLDRVVAWGSVRHSPMGLQWRSDGKVVVFLARDRGPLFQPWLWVPGEEPRVLEHAPRTALAVVAPVWHPDGKSFLYWADGNLFSAGWGAVTKSFRGAAGQTGFAWSPAGDFIAAVGALRPGHLQVRRPDGQREALIPVCPGGTIRDVIWTRQGLLVTARTAESEWFQVAKVELSGRCEWLSDGPGDKRRPAERNDGCRVWETHRNGVSAIASSEGQEYPAGSGLPATGYQAKGWRMEFISPSGVVAVSQPGDGPAVVYPEHVKIEEWRPQAVSVTSFDGAVLPAWLWEPEEIKGIVVDVHGAPRVAASPYRHPGLRVLRRQGIAVLGINFRGSGGAGRALEELTGDPAGDLFAVRQWLTHRWPGVPMVLHGHSFGAFLCLRSAVETPSEEVAGLVLASLPVPKDQPRLRAGQGLSITAFHGGWDVVASAQEAQACLKKISPDVRFTVFPEEGHAFHRRANVRRSYERAAEILKGSFTPRRDDATTEPTKMNSEWTVIGAKARRL